jgi:hypothetical protein
MIRYVPYKTAPRKGAKLRLVRHEWHCDQCSTLIHTEPVDVQLDDDATRVLRIKTETEGHTCPPKPKKDLLDD